MLTGCGCIYSCFYRTKMSKQYNLKGSDCGDCLKHSFCEIFALTQVYRELKKTAVLMSPLGTYCFICLLILNYLLSKRNSVPRLVFNITTNLLGCHGNVERQNAGVEMGAPVVEGGMMR